MTTKKQQTKKEDSLDSKEINANINSSEQCISEINANIKQLMPRKIALFILGVCAKYFTGCM